MANVENIGGKENFVCSLEQAKNHGSEFAKSLSDAKTKAFCNLLMPAIKH